ncbi:hypothetical protein TWF481_007666 [Arthrobotrys musiformis]|uniref:Peptidase A1 domain-containing protein n=1 Tax=Arthrobotrys musiformis TaxID=47236 RepID=A0AAV9WC52_9PEZI
MKLGNILPLLLVHTAHAAIFEQERIATVGSGDELAAPTAVVKRDTEGIFGRARKVADPDPEEQVGRNVRRARKMADPDPEEQARPQDPENLSTRVAKRAKPAPTIQGRKYADPDPEEQARPQDPENLSTRVAKRAKPAPTIQGRARKYADPDPEEQVRPQDPENLSTRVAKRAKPAPTVVEKRAKPAPTVIEKRAKPAPTVVEKRARPKFADPDPEEQVRPDIIPTRGVKRDDQAALDFIPLPTGRIEIPVGAHTPITNAGINARPSGVLDTIGLTIQTLCSAFIPFTNTGTGTGTFPDQSAPRVYMDLDGVRVWQNTPKGLLVDTGSTGFTIGNITWQTHFQKSWAATDKSRPGYKYLSSSKTLYKGYWVNVNITFRDLSWNPIIRSEIPVLVFDRKFKCQGGFDSAAQACIGTFEKLSPDGAYLGIGYGRRGDGMAQCTPDRNPFLSVKGIWRDLPATGCNYRNGYVVTKTGIYWGLNVVNTNNFKFHTLKKDSGVNMDWSMPTMCLRSSNNQQTCRAGNFLPDTGVIKSYITSPDIPSSGTAPPTGGLSLRLNVPDSGQGMATLNYNNVGSGGNHLPSAYSTTKSDTSNPRVYLNTGSRFFNNYETAFDADFGYFGLKKL